MNELETDNSLEDIIEDKKEKESNRQMVDPEKLHSNVTSQNNDKVHCDDTIQLPELNIELEDSEFPSENNYLKFLLFKLVPLEKLFILLPGKIMRFFLQIGDFYLFFIILSITLEYITIILVSNFKITHVFGCLVALFFSFLLGNSLAVFAWELFQLRWLRNKNPFQTIFNIWEINGCVSKCFYNIYDDQENIATKNNTNNNTDTNDNNTNDNNTNDNNTNDNNTNDNKNNKNFDKNAIYIIEKVSNFILGVLFYFYIWTLVDFMNSTGKKFDIMNFIILFVIPCLKYVAIYLSLLIVLIIKINKENKKNNKKSEHEYYEDDHSNDPFILARFKINHIKLCCGGTDNTDNCCGCINNVYDFCGDIYFIIKLVIIIAQLIFLIICYAKFHIKVGGVILNMITFICISLFSLFINMPIWIFNSFYRWNNCCEKHIINSTNYVNKKIRLNPEFNGFKYVNLISQIIPPLIVSVLLFIELNRIQENYFYITDEDIKWDGEISDNFPYIPSISTVKSSMCYTRIYGLNLIQIASLAAAPYYKDSNNYQMLLQNSFFKDPNVNITLKFIYQTDDHPVLLQIDYFNPLENYNTTIFAVRGSRTPTDWWLDIEMFVSSAMLSVARWIPFIQRQEGTTATFISDIMTWPLTLMSEATLTYQYTKELSYFFDEYLSGNITQNILFTGHSLGGGLSKVLAQKYQYQSIAVSGPGITPIENYFKNKQRKNDKYFKSKLVDIIPDRDLVPRFEVSGGTLYRVLCHKSFGECHNKLRTLCQMGISCDDEFHSGDFCTHIFNNKEYDEMRKLAHK